MFSSATRHFLKKSSFTQRISWGFLREISLMLLFCFSKLLKYTDTNHTMWDWERIFSQTGWFPNKDRWVVSPLICQSPILLQQLVEAIMLEVMRCERNMVGKTTTSSLKWHRRFMSAWFSCLLYFTVKQSWNHKFPLTVVDLFSLECI